MTPPIAPQVPSNPFATIQARLQTARHVVALTGAGMSQESGLPTYRALPDGLWNNTVVSEVATRNALRDDPQKVWHWHQAFAQRIRDCDVVLVIGTSNLIYPAAELPRYAMKRRKFVLEINPQVTPLSGWVSARLESSASVGLADLMGLTA